MTEKKRSASLFDPSHVFIGRLDSHYDYNGKLFTLAAAFLEIQSGISTVGRDYGNTRVADDNYKSLSLQQATERARSNKRKAERVLYERQKQELPAYAFGCTLDGRCPHTPSGILGIDLDDVDDIEHVKLFINASPYTLASFVTLGGSGLRVLTKIQPLSIPNNHHYAWLAVRNKYQTFAVVDTAGKEMNKLSALVYDPELYVNLNSIPVEWDVDKKALAAEFPDYEYTAVGSISGLPPDYLEQLQYLDFEDTNSRGWLRQRVPCPFTYGTPEMHEFDGWGFGTNATEVRAIEGGYELRCHKCDSKTAQFVANPTIDKVRKYSRYTPKLHRISNEPPNTESLKVLHNLLKKEVIDWEKRTQHTGQKHLLILGTGTGTGKSTTTLVNLTKYADISPTIELADEKFLKAANTGKNAFRHRSRLYNSETATGKDPYNLHIGLNAEFDEVPCAFPAQCNALAEKGHSPSKTFCPTCPFIEKCKSDGYLSQFQKMRQHDCVFLSWQDDYFSDSAYAQSIQQIAGNKDIVLVLDEPNPADLSPRRELNADKLLQKAEECDTLTTSFIHDLIKAISTATKGIDFVAAVNAVLESEKYKHALQTINERIAKIAVSVNYRMAENPETDLNDTPLYEILADATYRDKSVTCAVIDVDKVSPALLETFSDKRWLSLPDDFRVNKEYVRFLSLNEFCEIGFGDKDSLAGIAELPARIENLVSDLQDFLEISITHEPACQKTDNGWEFYLKPTMNSRRGIMTSASDIEKEIQALYDDSEIKIEVVNGDPPQWKAGNKLFQISTGRYTPRTALYTKGPGEWQLLKKGKEFIDLIRNEAKTGKKILTVGPKNFTSEGALKHLPEIAEMLATENISAINHHHAEGVNSYEDYDTSFVFLYEPIPTEIEQIAKRVYRDADLSFEREKVDLKKGGVVLKCVNRYVNSHVQRIYDKEVEKRLMQAITRLRQMIYAGKTCYLLTSEPISGLPVHPILFNINDAQQCQEKYGTLDTLEEYLAERSGMSVAEIAEADNVSERTVRYRTAEKRQAEKAELTERIYALKDSGLSVRKIAEALDISRGKVESALKKQGLS